MHSRTGSIPDKEDGREEGKPHTRMHTQAEVKAQMVNVREGEK